LKNLRRNKTASSNFKVTLARVHLRSGCVTSLLYEIKQPIPYIEGSYMIELRKRMKKMKIENCGLKDHGHQNYREQTMHL
jgi:hypothetical protein